MLYNQRWILDHTIDLLFLKWKTQVLMPVIICKLDWPYRATLFNDLRRPVPVVLRLLAFSLHSYFRILAAGYYIAQGSSQSAIFADFDLEQGYAVGRGMGAFVLRSLRRCASGYVDFVDRICRKK